MAKFKPLIASLVTIALAMGGLWAWSLLRGDNPRPHANNSASAPANTPDGIVIEQVVLDPRPQWDPAYLWPSDGQRMSSPQFWVLWKTDDFCDCRLLATKDEKLWFEVGRTAGVEHYLAIDLGLYDSSVTFAVDFVREGKKFRSKPRSVSYGRGAHFAQREYRFAVTQQPNQVFSLAVRGRDPIKVPGGNFMHGWFAGDLVVYYSPQPGDSSGGEVIFGVQDGKAVPAAGSVGFVEIYDEMGNCRDRALIHLKP